MHQNHKLIPIEEEELKKENIIIEESTKEFDENIKKLNKLKDSVEHEMIEIDKAYDKVDKEVTKSYEIKKETLKKEEEDLKDNWKIMLLKLKSN